MKFLHIAEHVELLKLPPATGLFQINEGNEFHVTSIRW